MVFRSLLLFLLINCMGKIKASDTTIVSALLKRVIELQPKENGVFPKGLFPSYRTYALNKERQKADINIFYSGLIVFTLEKIKSNLSPYQQSLVEQIVINAKPTANKFKNKGGRDTYNFWPTDTPMIFPNAGWLNLFDKPQALPDDLDDTVILLLALNVDQATAEKVHQLMQQYINKEDKRINNTFDMYKHIPAYSVWFGEKMPVDFDISVLSNVLYFVQANNLKWTNADSASLQLIVSVLKDKKHLTDANYISPHYGKTEIILYHLSRLMSLKPIPSLEKFRQDLIAQAKQLQQTKQDFLEQVILSSALLNWGEMPVSIQINENKSLRELIEAEEFSFFIANMASMLPNQMKKMLGSISVGKFTYYCPAYNNVLLIENMVLHSNYAKKIYQ